MEGVESPLIRCFDLTVKQFCYHADGERVLTVVLKFTALIFTTQLDGWSSTLNSLMKIAKICWEFKLSFSTRWAPVVNMVITPYKWPYTMINKVITPQL